MYRLTIMSGVPYAEEFDDLDEDVVENIEELVASGNSVLIVDDIDEVEDFGIDLADVVYA